ncbi:hypothetical protein [Williamsia sp. M5A3_1d]
MSGEDFRLDPDAATKVVNACSVLAGVIDGLLVGAGNLKNASGSGIYASGSALDKGLHNLGILADNALKLLKKEIEDVQQSARAAGQRLIDQDDESQRAIAAALNSPDGINPLTKQATGMTEYPLPKSNDPLAGATSMLGQPHGSPTAGPFPLGVTPEPLPNFNLDPALAALGGAVPGNLTTLAQQWAQLAQQLQAAFANFDAHISILGTEVFSGEAASKMKQSMTQFSDSGKRISDEAQANSTAISSWAGWVEHSKSQVQMLQHNRETALASATPENALVVHQSFDGLSQSQLSSTWNPPVGTMNGSMVNLSDPTSPVAGTPLYLPGMGPKAPSGGNNTLAGGQFSGGSGGNSGGGGGGAGGGGAAATASRNAASQLQRSGSGTPPTTGAAASGAKPGAAPSSGAGNPASAASQMGKSAEGLTRGGLGSASTKSSGLGAMKDAAAAEKAAAEKAAMKAAKAGGGGGGGGAGAGAGGLGKAGASESALSARGAGAMSAAEKALAAEQAATSKAGPAGTSAAPMGGRGAQAGGEGDGKHKTARYLRSTENGEEIVGELDDVAPTVLGGLNLDTSDDKPTPPRQSR